MAILDTTVVVSLHEPTVVGKKHSFSWCFLCCDLAGSGCWGRRGNTAAASG